MRRLLIVSKKRLVFEVLLVHDPPPFVVEGKPLAVMDTEGPATVHF